MTCDLAHHALIRDIARRLQLAAPDEVRVIDRVLQRLELGRERYGALDLSRPREWRRELREELLDALVYDVSEEIAAEDQARAELREAARAEMVGEQPDEVTIGLPGDRWDGDPIAIPESTNTGSVAAAAAAELIGDGGPR